MDLAFFKRAVEQIGEALQSYTVVVVKSTVVLETTEELRFAFWRKNQVAEQESNSGWR